MIPCRIAGTASLLPGRAVSNAELACSLDPPGNAAEIERKTGIKTRYVAPRGTEMAVVGAEVLRLALADARLLPSDLEQLIFVSSNGGDRIVPATANRLLAELDLRDRVGAFDLNNACVGFLNAFDLAARRVATGGGPVGIVVVELLTRGVKPGDFRPLVIFGDAAAAAVVVPGQPGEGILAAQFANDGTLAEDVVFYHPSVTGQLEYVQFKQGSVDMVKTVLDAMTRSARAALDTAGLAIGDMDWVLPHQPNGRLFRLVVEALGVDPARTVPVVQEIGSVAAASIPVSLDRLRREHRLLPGQTVLMVGVGAGVARGALVLRVGE